MRDKRRTEVADGSIAAFGLQPMSASLPKADIGRSLRNVRDVPLANEPAFYSVSRHFLVCLLNSMIDDRSLSSLSSGIVCDTKIRHHSDMTSRLQKYVMFFVICMVAVLAGIVGITIGQSIAGHTPESFSIVLRVALFAFGFSALVWLWRLQVDAA